jgi:histone-lysine N-methyltransferase SETMAR
METSLVEIRAVIKFLTMENNNPKQIHERLMNVYGDSAPAYSTIAKWVAEFKRGRQSLEDDPRSGRPSEAVTPEVSQMVEDLVLTDRRIKIAEMARIMGISVGSVSTILHDKLGMSKVSARWVPRLLTAENKALRVELAQQLSDKFSADPQQFLSRLVTGDEVWIHCYDPETKQQSMQWVHKGSPPPLKFRTQPSAGKIMATIFWDARGLLFINYLPPKTTITGQYYADILRQLRQAIKLKRPGMLTRGVLLLHDNAPVHKSKLAQAALRECGFEQLDHPPYSPDLAPSDYYLFRQLKLPLRGRRFSDDSELKDAVEQWFSDQPSSFFYRGLESLKTKWDKCISIKGDYIEKL